MMFPFSKPHPGLTIVYSSTLTLAALVQGVFPRTVLSHPFPCSIPFHFGHDINSLEHSGYHSHTQALVLFYMARGLFSSVLMRISFLALNSHLSCVPGLPLWYLTCLILKWTSNAIFSFPSQAFPALISPPHQPRCIPSHDISILRFTFRLVLLAQSVTCILNGNFLLSSTTVSR